MKRAMLVLAMVAGMAACGGDDVSPSMTVAGSVSASGPFCDDKALKVLYACVTDGTIHVQYDAAGNAAVMCLDASGAGVGGCTIDYFHYTENGASIPAVCVAACPKGSTADMKTGPDDRITPPGSYP